MARLGFVTQIGRALLTGIILLFTIAAAIAQTGTITGKVVSKAGKIPLVKASVFLSNATYGTITADDGTFTLYNVKPGQYQFVVTNVGFEDHVQTVMVTSEVLKLDIEMMPKVTELRAVVITTNADWLKNYELFKKQFIGESANSKKCKVINPRILTLAYYGSKRLLEAYADEFLVVENKALGYRVKYLVKDFKSDGISNIISYEGKALFEELPGSISQKKKWREKRDEAYYGSARHFYRALYTGKMDADGFVTRRFTREPNPERPPEALIQRKFKQFKKNLDSVNYWSRLAALPKYYNENLIREPLKTYDILFKSEQPGIFALGADRYLYIVYTKKREETYFRDLYRPLDMENFETTVITFFNPYVYFDMNGTVLGDAPLYEGTWSKSKLAELLPVDYVPGD
ncbi:MAG: carboxypeptidase-like regulatory domain-containing protein [Sphingobacteriaceae bacterium]|nr:MAG: carboxypeptidase-like regulatory domain-containing protein [Sphingobacteriaceae bacterium]